MAVIIISVIVILLTIKIHKLRQSARESADTVAGHLSEETNALIDILLETGEIIFENTAFGLN